MSLPVSRRNFVKAASSVLAVGALPPARSEEAARRFEPRATGWRRFEGTTTLQLRDAAGGASVWLPVPSLETPWQRTTDASWTGNASNVRIAADGATGARVLVARFDAGTPDPRLVLTNRVETQNRVVDWKERPAAAADPADLRH